MAKKEKKKFEGFWAYFADGKIPIVLLFALTMMGQFAMILPRGLEKITLVWASLGTPLLFLFLLLWMWLGYGYIKQKMGIIGAIKGGSIIGLLIGILNMLLTLIRLYGNMGGIDMLGLQIVMQIAGTSGVAYFALSDLARQLAVSVIFTAVGAIIKKKIVDRE